MYTHCNNLIDKHVFATVTTLQVGHTKMLLSVYLSPSFEASNGSAAI